MINIEFSHNGYTFKRVTKAVAKKAYNDGLDVVFCPSNLRPFGFWHTEVIINKNHSERDFNMTCIYFSAYNCINTETGKYIAFYIPVKSNGSYDHSFMN